MPVSSVAADGGVQQAPRIEVADVDDAAPQWTARHTASALAPSLPDSDALVGNIVGGASAGIPHRASHFAGTAGGGRASASKSVGGVSGAAAEYSGPGLPGALRGSGLPSPDYPEEARRRRQQGTVRVALEVREDGSLGNVTLVSDGGFPLLGRAAMDAARRLVGMHFEPAREGGRAVRAVLEVPYVFQLK